jgi:hypothetical protein
MREDEKVKVVLLVLSLSIFKNYPTGYALLAKHNRQQEHIFLSEAEV